MNKYCIYRHIRLDTNKVFYIGIGDPIRRPYTKYKRNKFWKNIVNKTEYEIQILKSDLSWEEACELEKILISWYGRRTDKTGILTNLTLGGDGVVGFKLSNETKMKIGLSSRNRIPSVETRIKMSEVRTYPIINMDTNEIIKNTNLICEKLNITKRYLSQMVTNKRTNITPFKYLKDLNNINIKYNEQKIK